MPALRLFGRKWLAASDDLVFPCLFEICFRLVWLVLLGCVTSTYWIITSDCKENGLPVRIYLIGTIILIGLNLMLLVAIVNRSAQGSIADTYARRHVAPLLVCKFILIPPELALNIFGTIWAFCDLIQCSTDHVFSRTVIEGIVLFNWVVFALILFGLAIVFDPLGSIKYKKGRDSNDNNVPSETTLHRKFSNLWLRRFRWIFCCLRKDEFGQEAFSQVANLLSALFRGTDLVPSDIMAGCILLRIRQKREVREMRRIRMLNDDGPRYSTDTVRIFSTAPTWMTLDNAKHFMQLALASYGWPMVCYMNCCTGPFSLIKKSTCCACFRPKTAVIVDDNCCLCHVAGIKHISTINDEDILYASFKNHVFELPFCILADHHTKSIVISVRGSLSMRDVFTDLTANAEKFEAVGFPSDSYAHKGMLAGSNQILKVLHETRILERSFNTYPEYTLAVTGHSLGAGVAIILAAKLRSKYSDLRVYAFATPAGLLSREAARYSETFTFTLGVGDDFVMRLAIETIESLRTSVLETIRACKLPKWRIMLNGVGYVFFGVPSRDLEKTWKDVTDIEGTNNNNNNNNRSGQSPLLCERPIQTVTAVETESSPSSTINNEPIIKRYNKARLFTGGRILHIVRRKKTEMEKKSNTGGPTYEMRWSTPEDFSELRVMPRMLLDHVPDNILSTLTTILEQQQQQQQQHQQQQQLQHQQQQSNLANGSSIQSVELIN